jgi:hypothetical protein
VDGVYLPNPKIGARIACRRVPVSSLAARRGGLAGSCFLDSGLSSNLGTPATLGEVGRNPGPNRRNSDVTGAIGRDDNVCLDGSGVDHTS